jgi:type I restriction enzyme S subunit
MEHRQGTEKHSGETPSMSGIKRIEFTQIAADWNSIKLGEESPQALLAIRNGLTTKQDQDKGDYKVSRIETIGGGWIDETRVRYASDVSEKDIEKYRIQKGDILFSHINSDPHLGKTGYADRNYKDLLHGMNLLLIRANPKVFEPEFLNRTFQYYREIGVFISICSRSVNQSSINQAKLKAVEVPLPPLPEQKKIAHILSTVQRAIEAQERIIQTTTELKKALMHKLFTEGLRGEPQKQTEIGPVPESWAIKTVGDYCDILNGYAFKSEDYVTTGGIPNFRVVNISWDGSVSMDDCKLLPESFYVSHAKYLLNEGDILFVMVGATRGKLAQIPASILPALMNQNMWRIVPSREGIDRDYLFHHLRRSVVGLLQEDDDQARGFFKKSDFRDIPLAIPSLPEQIEIRTALGTLETKLGLHAAKTTQLQDLFRTLLHELMTAKTRVQDLEISAPVTS